MRYTLNLFRNLTIKKFLTIGTMITLISQPLFAEIQAQKVSTYKDEKTGLTLVIAEVELTGWQQPVQPDILAPLSQLATIKVDPIRDENLEDEPGAFRISPNTKVRYRFAGILRDANANEALITLHHPKNNSTQTLRLNLKEAQKQAATIEDFHDWARNRTHYLDLLAKPSSPNLIRNIWRQKSQLLYGTEMARMYTDNSWDDNDIDEQGIGSLATFGGQTAIRETLQTQLLTSGSAQITTETKPLIDIATIKGVEVRPHPYSDMLKTLKTATTKEDKTPSTSLANYVPIDRLMILIREPKDIANLLNTDNDTFTRLTPLLGNGFADNALIERYTARFGLTPEQLKQWFSGNNVEEAAIFVPDVFFLDSTDLTAVIRLKPNASTPFKIAQQLPRIILPLRLPKGDTFYLVNRDSLLFLSTNKVELEKSLTLADEQGKGSLGESDEFQVMNYKLPLDASSRLYVYFSDPFIRRLTSPALKIGQLRRAMARQQMETITAMALLYRLDHGVDAENIDTLKKRGYLSEQDAPTDEFILDKGLQVVSKTWGTLAHLKTLVANPVTQITEQEANSYNIYRNRYTDFWREYFDPIAVRADITTNGNIALETFILPLIDNSIYNSLKEIVGTEKPVQTAIPLYSKTPIATLAFNIPKQHTKKNLKEFYFLNYSLHSLLPVLGNTAVLSVQDSDPVIQANFPGMGSLNNRRGIITPGGEELLIAPIIGALLTRPVDIAIQVTDEEKARNALQNISIRNNRYSSLEKVYNEKDNTLLLDWTVMGVLRMEFAISVEKGWLHISNHPWTPVPITGTQQLEPNHATVILNPSKLQKALAQIVSLAQSSYRQSVYTTAAELLPWMTAYNIDAETALAMQKHALGRATPLPTEVLLENKGFYQANPYGYWLNQKMPSLEVKNDAAFAHLLQNLNLWLRFEEDGLRSRVEFTSN